MLSDYTANLTIDPHDLEVTSDTTPNFGLGCWVYENDTEGNPNVFVSPGIYGYSPYIDLQRQILGILMVKTAEGKADDPFDDLRAAVIDALDGEVESFGQTKRFSSK